MSLSHVQLFMTPRTVACQTSLILGIFQARILECIAISFSRQSSWPRDWTQVSHIADSLPSEPPVKGSCKHSNGYFYYKPVEWMAHIYFAFVAASSLQEQRGWRAGLPKNDLPKAKEHILIITQRFYFLSYSSCELNRNKQQSSSSPWNDLKSQVFSYKNEEGRRDQSETTDKFSRILLCL